MTPNANAPYALVSLPRLPENNPKMRMHATLDCARRLDITGNTTKAIALLNTEAEKEDQGYTGAERFPMMEEAMAMQNRLHARLLSK